MFTPAIYCLVLSSVIYIIHFMTSTVSLSSLPELPGKCYKQRLNGESFYCLHRIIFQPLQAVYNDDVVKCAVRSLSICMRDVGFVKRQTIDVDTCKPKTN